MLSEFNKHIHTQHLFTAKHHLLLAISGGIDSVVLAHLLKQGDYKFELAHCNFKLRGKDSEADEKFCRALAESLHVPFHCKAFDVDKYRKQHKLSTQIAARHLRYEWFEELLRTKGLDFVLTAHHANDSIETLFINLLRGTGINGLKGIPERNGNIVRPMLAFTKQEIEKFAKSEKLKHRLDKSNLEKKYERNSIRLSIIPKLKELNPSFESTFIKNLNRFNEEAALLQEYLLEKKKELVKTEKELIYFSKAGILAQQHCSTVLNFLLKQYGFNETQQQDIYTNIVRNSLVGKNFYSSTHHLTIDRKNLVIRTNQSETPLCIEIHHLGDFHTKANMHVVRVKKFGIAKKNEIYLNINKLVFPITIRNKHNGEKFKPFGMNGFKLVSDHFKDEKLNHIEKEKCLVMVNGNGQIIWLIGLRSDERYRISPSDTNLIKLICES